MLLGKNLGVSSRKHKPSKLKEVKRYIAIFFPIVFFFVGVYLLFNYVQKDTLSQIDEDIKEKKLTKALNLVNENLKDQELNQLKLLMYGSIIKYMAPTKSLLEDPYTKKLFQEDKMKIYLEESYIRKFDYSPRSQIFIPELCRFVDRFPQASFSKKVTSILEKSFSNPSNWSSLTQLSNKELAQCSNNIFYSDNNYLKQKRLIVRGDKLNLRSEASNLSSSVTKLKKGTKIIKISQTQKEVIVGKKAPWFFVLTENMQLGYLFSAYVGTSSPVSLSKASLRKK